MAIERLITIVSIPEIAELNARQFELKLLPPIISALPAIRHRD